MSYKPLVNEEAPPQEAKPNYEVLAAEERARREEIERRLQEKQQEFETRMAEAERARASSYGGGDRSIQPEPTPEQQAAFELGLSEEDTNHILGGNAATIFKIT